MKVGTCREDRPRECGNVQRAMERALLLSYLQQPIMSPSCAAEPGSDLSYVADTVGAAARSRTPEVRLRDMYWDVRTCGCEE